MQYQDILVKANNTDDPVLRLMYVAIFNMGQYKSTLNRVAKPFNPILGETFELDQPEFRFLSE